MTAAGPLAILAGGGTLPAEVAAEVTASGRPVLVFPIIGEASQACAAFPHRWIKRGQLGTMLGEARRHGARDLLVIGGIRERRLPRISECDLTGLWHLVRHLRLLTHGDDGVLRRVARLIEAGGVRLVGVGDVAPRLVAPLGAAGFLIPDVAADRDIAAGVAEARLLGVRDIGQGVVVREGRIVAREDRRGTDAMLADLADGSARGGVLVKSIKPQQDRRLDMPAIGPETVRRAVAAGLKGIAVSAGGALLAEREELVSTADRAGLFIIGFPADGSGGVGA